MAGVDLFSVSKILGHHDLKTTERYAHLSPEHLQQTVKQGSLGGVVQPAAGTMARTRGYW